MSIGQQVAQQVTRINDEVETQKTMMENIDGMLDDLGAERVEGGVQLETCTVTIECYNSIGNGVVPIGAFTTLTDDGSISCFSLADVDGTWTNLGGQWGKSTYVIENVIKNTAVGLLNNNLDAPIGHGYSITGATILGIHDNGYNYGIVLKITGDCEIIFDNPQ